ncbi:MAG: DUF2878 domain-containing protein [Calditrichaeota bacterium]|nr:DUF2878 domain-containing protein [Candidatus Cloacimonadota bacterium]MCA9786715.1 DUF2878 domain-containing protein [Candidatus Cloacimonadota bacterium]MCB1048268.1 DUF2878 domain-containing protein [Calditrichota bacterium]MCB9473144.1 DUF2878 domain-containing protein [Candidatus Delongbacteria bacterium]
MVPWLLGNALANQLVWFAAVLGAARGSSLPGVAMALLFLLVQLRLLKDPGRELGFVLLLTLAGGCLDSILSMLGLVDYAPSRSFDWLAPAWIWALWLSFALTVRHSLRSLLRRAWAAPFLGLAGAPLAYMAAHRMQAVEVALPGLLVIGLCWSLFLSSLGRVLSENRPALRLALSKEGKA